MTSSDQTKDRSMFSVFAALTAIACFLLATAAIVAVSAKTDIQRHRLRAGGGDR